jgi:hypothetical protein
MRLIAAIVLALLAGSALCDSVGSRQGRRFYKA